MNEYTPEHIELWDAIDKYSDCPRGSIARAIAREEVELAVAKAHGCTPASASQEVFTRERERWIFRRGISVATGDLIGADDETADREIAKCPL